MKKLPATLTAILCLAGFAITAGFAVHEAREIVADRAAILASDNALAGLRSRPSIRRDYASDRED